MTLFRRAFAIGAIFLIGVGSAFSFDTLKITAALDTAKKQVSGMTEFRLTTGWNLRSFDFQLFPNVYSGDDSPYLRTRSAFLERASKYKTWGGMDIDSIFVDGLDLTSELDVDYTMGRVALDGAGGDSSRKVQIYFKTRIPEFSDRLFYRNDEYLLDGWFPFPAALDSGGGWRNPHYGAFCELVGEYFQYDVDFSVPHDFIVAAPVPPYNQSAEGDLTRYKYSFGPAHDFALAVSPRYLIDSCPWNSTIARFFYRPFEKTALDRVKNAARAAVDYLVNKVGPYSYPYITYVFADFSFSGGLELPGMAILSSPQGMSGATRLQESIVIHETTHQWFYGMIGSDQTESPWMDEAITCYFSDKIQIDIFGESANLVDWGDFKIANNDMFRWMYNIAGHRSAKDQPAYSYATQTDYFGSIYAGGGLALETFDRTLGDSLIDSFWREYYRRFLFRRPASGDFMNLASELAGDEKTRLLCSLLDNLGGIDYSVERLDNQRIDSAGVRINFVLRKKGNLDYPVKYNVILINGDTLKNVWDSPYSAEAIVIDAPHPAVAVVVDPDNIFAIDRNLLNNSLALRADNRPGARLSSGIMFLIESLLSLVGGI
jgi:hypothetical protein